MGQNLRKQPFWVNDKQVDQQGFSTELLGRAATEFIQRNAGSPFFLQVAFNAVHNFTHQLPADYLKQQQLTGYPGDWDPAVEPYYDWYQKGRYPNNPEGREQYLGQLHYLDVEVGRLLDDLEKQKLLNNTLVIFISDNGGSTPIYANNAPLRGGKYTLYEGGIRVPFVIAAPEQYPPAQVNDNLVSAMDILPTVMAVAGVQIPSHVDGLDLTPLLNGQNPNLQHEQLIWDTGYEVAVREGRWKYRRSDDASNANYEMVDLEVGEFLHDLQTDLGETTNVAEKYPEVLQRMRSAYTIWHNNLSNK